MFKRKMLSLMLASVGLAAACSSPPRDGLVLRMEPVLSIRSAAGNAQGKYELGRYYQGQRRFAAAVKAYEEALALDPGLYLAANNLGVIAASQGEYEQAIAQFRVALARQPDVALLHNNLGYVFLLQMQNGEALAEFDTALRLEPGNVKAAANRQLAWQRLDLAQQATELSLVAPVVGPEIPAPQPIVETELAALVPVAAVEQPVGMEIANGNGVTGMALRLRSFLREKSLAKVRLTNERPFTRQETTIIYRPGFESSARELKRKLPWEVAMVESRQLRQGVDVRLVLGKDIASLPVAVGTTGPSWLARLK